MCIPGADGQLEYVGPATTISNRPGGVGIVFVKDKWSMLPYRSFVLSTSTELSLSQIPLKMTHAQVLTLEILAPWCPDALYVNLLVKNGPAHLSMQVQQGDLLRSVNGAQDIPDPLKVPGPCRLKGAFPETAIQSRGVAPSL